MKKNIQAKHLLILLLLSLLTLNTAAQKRYKFYNQFRRNKTSRLTPPLSVGLNAGVFFPNIIAFDNEIYKQKDLNPAYGISLEKRLFYNVSLRVDAARGKLSANNFKSKPATHDSQYAYYRNFTTDINYTAGISLTGTFPILTKKQFYDHPVFIHTWIGAGIIDFETQFVQYPETPIYYGKVTDIYKHFGVAGKYRLSDFSEVGLNYMIYFYDGYNLDAVKVRGPHKDQFSFAYVSMNFIIGGSRRYR
jgi:OmpA-OmpF porin, OOP family